jgi:hypothetical protein
MAGDMALAEGPSQLRILAYEVGAASQGGYGRHCAAKSAREWRMANAPDAQWRFL